jgi:hypothetical protein
MGAVMVVGAANPDLTRQRYLHAEDWWYERGVKATTQ